MYIYDYYIIIYDKLNKYEKYHQEFISKKDKQKISENNINPIIDQSFNNKNIDQSNNDIKIEKSNNDSIDLIKLENQNQEPPKYKSVKESINWIRKIFTKLIFMYHPDKQIDSNDEVFSKIKNDFDKNDFSSIFYYFIKNKHHPYLSKLFNEMIQDKRFMNSLLNLSNYYNYKLNTLLINNNFIEYLKQNNLFDER
jgi:hypothetical protein